MWISVPVLVWIPEPGELLKSGATNLQKPQRDTEFQILTRHKHHCQEHFPNMTMVENHAEKMMWNPEHSKDIVKGRFRQSNWVNSG